MYDVWNPAYISHGKSLPGTKINMCTATAQPKEVTRPRSRTFLRGLVEAFLTSYQRRVGCHFWPKFYTTPRFADQVSGKQFGAEFRTFLCIFDVCFSLMYGPNHTSYISFFDVWLMYYCPRIGSRGCLMYDVCHTSYIIHQGPPGLCIIDPKAPIGIDETTLSSARFVADVKS